MTVADEVRRYWDADSVVYDDVPHHHPTNAAEQAAWLAALADLLPRAPARVLDRGAGTGFLSIAAARLGHRVTALDLSSGMLQRLREKAKAGGLEIEVIEGGAEQPPPGEFDAVIERHLMWTLPDPVATLRAWRTVAPTGRLVVFEGIWGAADPLERLRRTARSLLTRAAWTGGASLQRGGHHAEYPASLREQLPLGGGTSPAAVTAMVSEAGWPAARLRRLRDIEWASTLNLGLPGRLVGVPPAVRRRRRVLTGIPAPASRSQGDLAVLPGGEVLLDLRAEEASVRHCPTGLHGHQFDGAGSAVAHGVVGRVDRRGR